MGSKKPPKSQHDSGGGSIAEQRSVVQWQQQTVKELSHAIPVREQMVVSILAAAWRPKANVWQAKTLKRLLEMFARDVNTATEHRIADAIRLIDSGASVMESLASTAVVGELTNKAIRIAIANERLTEFFVCWQRQPIAIAELTPHEQNLTANLIRFVATVLLVMNILLLIMLFIIPQFQKLFQEFGLVMTPAAHILIVGSDYFLKLWFVPTLLTFLLGIFYLRGSTFALWWNRWFPNSWTVAAWDKKDQVRLVTAWELRPMRPGQSEPLGNWERQLSSEEVLTKSESAALSLTDDKELRDWLLEKMVVGRREKRAQMGDRWATVLFGVGHCLLGGVVLLLALSVFGSLLSIVEGLAGARP